MLEISYHGSERRRALLAALLFFMMKRVILLVVLMLFSVPVLQAQTPTATPLPETPRERLQGITNYIVYYGLGREDDLARYDLAIIQPETLTLDALNSLKAEGTLVIAYLSLGEVEPYRPWYSDGRFDRRWSLGENKNWGSFFVNANETGWQDLMIEVAEAYLDFGFDGLFLDTVDTAVAFPQTEPGMITLIERLRAAYPEAILVQNRGFTLAPKLAETIDAVMFESLSTSYDFEQQEYLVVDNTTYATPLLELQAETDLIILALDYAEPGDTATAQLAVDQARELGFVPAVSVILLNDLPDYGVE